MLGNIIRPVALSVLTIVALGLSGCCALDYRPNSCGCPSREIAEAEDPTPEPVPDPGLRSVGGGLK